MNAEYTGKKIAQFRKEKNMTQKELASKLHITDKAVSKWERGINFPDLGLMEDLAILLGTTPSILLGIEDSSKEEIMTSLVEISTQQAKETARDIEEISWASLLSGILLLLFMGIISRKLQRNGLYFEARSVLWLINGLVTLISVCAIYMLRKYKSIRELDWLDGILILCIVFDSIIFLFIQLYTGRNPVYVVSGVLIGIAIGCLQALFYRVMKPQVIKALPLILSISWLIWSVLLELAKASWMTSNIWHIVVFYVLPMICCAVSFGVCRKFDSKKENLLPSAKQLVIICVTVICFMFMFGQDLMAKAYVKVFHQNLENYANTLLETCEDITLDRYLIWDVTCYPEDELVEFHTGGAGLVANSTYLGFYYSPGNVHKVFQGVDIPLNINDNLAEWYGEGDNWGRSTRLFDKWFWFEANF